MKRLLAILFVAALLLSGCTDKSTPLTAETGSAAPTQNVAQTDEAKPAETTAPTADYVASYPDPVGNLPTDANGQPSFTVPASPADPELSNNNTGATNPVAPVRLSGGKIKVYTDDSKYSSFRLPEAKYTRLREEPMTEFEPTKGLGTVYPYAAAPIFSKGGEGGWSSLGGYHWGLMDKNGRLLTDGIYLDVDPLEYVDYSSDDYEYIHFPFWVVSQLGDVRVVSSGIGEDSWSYLDGDMLYGLVSMDGSFATPIKYRSIYAQRECVIAMEDWSDPWSCDVYDTDGSLMLSGRDLPRRNATGFELQYSEGLFTVSYYYGNDQYACFYLDQSGKELLGPYEQALPFSDGLACVSAVGERYGYIDKSGNWVIEQKYETSASFCDGQAIQELDGQSIVIDKSGREVFRTEPGTYLTRKSYGYEGDSWTDERQCFYDFTGKLLKSVGSGEQWLQTVRDDVYCYVEDDTVTILRITEPEKSCTLPGYFVRKAYALKDGKPVPGYAAVTYDADQYYFVTEDLSESWELKDDPPNENEYSIMGYHPICDLVTGEPIKTATERGKLYFFNQNDELLGVCPRTRSNSDIIGGLLRSITDYACTYTDAAGKTILCYPLSTALDD